MKLTYHKAVQRKVDAACDWYDERKDRLGDEFFQEVERTLGLIALNPQAFPLAPFGRRKAHLKRFPYAVCYRILADRVRILSVRHDKRHPSYGVGRKCPKVVQLLCNWIGYCQSMAGVGTCALSTTLLNHRHEFVFPRWFGLQQDYHPTEVDFPGFGSSDWNHRRTIVC